jgi:hypothetical protein
MAVRMSKAWTDCAAAAIAALPGQLGVFELADGDGEVIYIGCADARTLFGLRSEVAVRASELDAAAFRVEVTSAYRSRWLELLMAHRADHHRLPRGNPEPAGLGRLSPA